MARFGRRRRARSSGSRSAAAASSPASTCCCTRRPTRPGSTRRCSSCTTAPSTRDYAGLTRFLDVMSWEERIPPLRAALIQPVDRNETYSASALYAAALARELLPEIAKRVPHKRRIGMGASLGGLAMLHAHRATRSSSTACCSSRAASSGNAPTSRSARFPRYRRITQIHRHGAPRRSKAHGRSRSRSPAAPPRRTARTTRPSPLRSARRATRRGSALVRDAHNWTCWRDAFDPHLPALIEAVRMNRRVVDIDGGSVIAYGHYGRPLVAFPSENGEPHDWEDRGMVDAIAPLLDDGKVKLYCIPSFDRESWTRGDLPLEERARRHGHYEWWLLTQARPVRPGRLAHARADCGRRVVRRVPRGELLPEARRPRSRSRSG